MAPTPSVYLFTGEGTVDETVWPSAGVQALAMEGEPARPLYHFAGDNPTAEPPTTNGANVPGWELYTGPTEPVGTVAPTSSSAPAEPAATDSAATTAAAPEAESTTEATASTDGTTPETPQTAPAAPETPSDGAAQPDAPETEPTPAAAPETAAIPPAVIEGVVYRGRDDNDVLTGSFCRVIAGEHTGRYGVLMSTATLNLDGWPATVVIRTRDDRSERLTVNYADIRPAQPGGR